MFLSIFVSLPLFLNIKNTFDRYMYVFLLVLVVFFIPDTGSYYQRKFSLIFVFCANVYFSNIF